MIKVKDHKHRTYRFTDGSVITACGSDGENICGIDYVEDGKVVYCLTLEDNPYHDILAKLFDEVTRIKNHD